MIDRAGWRAVRATVMGGLVLAASELCGRASAAPPSDEQKVSIESAALGETRTLRVVLPASSDTSKAGYPLIVVLDGEYNTWYVSSIVRFLQGVGEIPPCVVVGIENTERERDMTPPDMKIAWLDRAEGDRFLAFMEKELLPRVGQMVKLSGLRVIVGHSHGGIFGSWVLCERPELFQIAVALDSPWQLDDFYLVRRLQQRFKDRPTEPVRLVVGETRFPFSDSRWADVTGAAPAGSMLVKFQVKDETHETMGFQGTYTGLKTAFKAYADAKLERATPQGIDDLCADLAKSLGGPVAPTPALYRQGVRRALLDAKAADAIAILERWRGAYGDSPQAAEFDADIEACAKHGPLAETVSDMVNGPRASDAEMAPYIGTWRGTSDFAKRQGGRAEWTAEISVQDGKGQAVLIHHLPDGETMRQDAVVVRVRDGALQFGVMNGMHPRGVLLYTVTPGANASELAGQFSMAGVWFNWPDDIGPPTAKVRMVKQK